MKRLTVGLCLLAAPLFGAAQDPVQWTLTFDAASAAPGSSVLAKFIGKIEPGWHLYSPTTPKGGPIPTVLSLADNPAVAGVNVFQSKPERKFDPNFQLDTETFQDQAPFLLQIQLKPDAPKGPVELTAKARYQCCNDRLCLPPRTKTATATLTIDPAAANGAVVIPAGFFDIASAPAASSKPVGQTKPLESDPDLGRFLLIAFGAGLAAIFTPCVFPMIPFTVSYFLKRENKAQSEGLIQAFVFCLGIIVLFTGLGLLTKAIAGPFGVVQLGSSPWVNGFIVIVFVVFGLSLLGAYELTLPSGLLTKLDQASQRGGYLGTLLMGLTFSLTSFACVGPIVGPLLVASVQSNSLRPVLGMLTFATGLAAPFFLLALFPSYLQKMPKSGGWLMRVKVVLGFIVLAAAIKYLSNIDQVLQTNFLSREVFLAAWVVLFALPGLYLLGFLRLEGIKPEEHLGVGRMLAGAAFLIFAISLLPGMLGAKLGELDAYIPAATANLFSPAASPGEGAQPWLKNQYREALAQARRENKLVFINFTGYACTNCHWMKANMFPKPEISSLLKGYVLVDLFTDGSDAVSEENQRLEEKKFETVAIPFYVIEDPDEKVIATFPGLTKKTSEFAGFLKTGSVNRGLATASPGKVQPLLLPVLYPGLTAIRPAPFS
jgi:thiol:disulfide interchange protein DsbD